MGGFNPAWFIAVGVGVILAAIGQKKKWARRLLFALGFVFLGVGFIGIVMPKKSNVAVTQKPTEPAGPIPQPQLPAKKSAPKSSHGSEPASGRNSASIGTLSLGPGSIAQIGGSGNSAIINNRSSYPEINDETLLRLADRLHSQFGSIKFETRNAENDAFNCAARLQTLFSRAQWRIVSGENVNAPPDADDEGSIPIPSGLHLYPGVGKAPLAEFVKEQLKSEGIASAVETAKTRFQPEHMANVDIVFFVGNP